MLFGLASTAFAEPTVKAPREAGLDAYLAGIERAAERQRNACDRLSSEAPGEGGGRTVWLRGDGARFGAEGERDLAQGDRSWAQAALGVARVVEALGGGSAREGRAVMLRRTSDGYYVGLDGVGMNQFDDPCAALGYLFGLLVADNEDIPAVVREAVAAANGQSFAALVGAATAAAPEAVVLARGVSTTVQIQNAALSGAGMAPSVIGPQGIAVTGVSASSQGGLSAAVTVSGATPLGAQTFFVYPFDHRFASTLSAPVTIVAGNDAGAPLGDAPASGGVPVPLALNQPMAGRLTASASQSSYQITVTAAGVLTAASSGMTDVVGTLEDGAGNVVARNDDGGHGYNFRISQPVVPGTYVLRVSHCCSGTGDFAVQATLQPPGSPLR